MKLVSWNIQHKHKSWRCLLKTDADVALLQEARTPPDDVIGHVEIDPAPFRSDDGKSLSRCAIVKLTDKVTVEWLVPVSIEVAQSGDLMVSQPGCVSAAIVTPTDSDPITVVSFCPEYNLPHRSTGNEHWLLVDPSLHRVISDLSLFIGRQNGHRIIAAGDLTVIYGYGKNEYWRRREHTVFDRMDALGLKLVGPWYPNGRKAVPHPTWLPSDSANVPTFRRIGGSVGSETSQLDYVFVSEGMENEVKVRALNRPHEWGPSDHCRIEIETS